MRPRTNPFPATGLFSDCGAGLFVLFSLLSWVPLNMVAADPAPPSITHLSATGSQRLVEWSPYPATVQYRVFSADNILGPYTVDESGSSVGNVWTAPPSSGMGFFKIEALPMDSQSLLASTLLNRLAYGPTPDELERVKSMGVQAFIQEQVAPETITDRLDIFTTEKDWQFVSVTGNASSSTLYLYLTSASDVFIDDVSVVAGADPAVGANLVQNGGFESALTGPWRAYSNLITSEISSEQKHSGNSSLHLIATGPGNGASNSVLQTITPALRNGQQYTLGFWYLPTTNNSTLTVRLSGNGLRSDLNTRGPITPATLFSLLDSGRAVIDDLRAYHVLRAVQSPRQLLEILDQFFENHFVTQYDKSNDFFDRYYDDSATRGRLATQLEFKENQRWRQTLLQSTGTFYDLLRISAESPAMIIYLDTVNSRGDGRNIANENYARELFELFAFGVDNGYDQTDIVECSKCWTGWSVRLVDPTNEFNPTLPSLQDLNPTVAVSNLAGVWAFSFRTNRHNNNAKALFAGKTVPARFGAPYAGRSYELRLPARNGIAGIQDGSDVLRHVADQPFTQEFLSVKLCRLLVHDDFRIGYDFTDPNLSEEGKLVQQCMLAWENGSPKGQIRQVLNVIFGSELFRAHGASGQKIKTPLEFTVSAIRALRSANSDGSFTASTDGYSLKTPLNRMGSMSLFNRAEPDGYPESAEGWISAGTLVERVRYVQSTCMPTTDGKKNDGFTNRNFTDPVSLLKNKLSAANWNNALEVASYFVSILYPGEGKANLEGYANLAVDFLNTADNGVTSSPFASLTVSNTAGSAYDTRVRGMVAMLMTMQRFQEQ